MGIRIIPGLIRRYTNRLSKYNHVGYGSILLFIYYIFIIITRAP